MNCGSITLSKAAPAVSRFVPEEDTEMKDLSERIAALSPEQRVLFEARLKRQGLDASKAAAPARAIPRRRPADPGPLSFDQERLWRIDRNEPGNPAYNIYTASRLRGPLAPPVMQRAINEIVRRHEILRASFAVVDGQPVMKIAPELKINLAIDDLSTLPESAREAEALRRVNQEVGRPFDLERGPLVRTGLLRLADDDYILHLTMHHTITDRWSAAIVEEELAALYHAFSRGEPSPLAEPIIQFPDFAAWQREWLQGDVLASQLAYWKSQLEGAPFVLNLPTDHRRPAVQTFRGARERIWLSSDLLAALKALSQAERATRFMVVLAAYNLVLYRLSGQADILVGLTVSNRDRPETVGMLGYLLNMVALRTRLADDMSFRQLLRGVRESALGAFAHQDLPLSLLIKKFAPQPDPSRNPIFQVSYIYLDFPELLAMNEVGLSITPLAADNGSSRFDLTLALTERSSGIDTLFEYNTDLFDRMTVKKMLRHLEAILEAVARDPAQRISQLA
jgi:Condensation domain